MNVASYELCKELWELSGWEPDYYWKSGYQFKNQVKPHYVLSKVNDKKQEFEFFAYDLGFLLRKLPGVELQQIDSGWVCTTKDQLNSWSLPSIGEADSPEDAAALLAIALFKAGVLTREGEGE